MKNQHPKKGRTFLMLMYLSYLPLFIWTMAFCCTRNVAPTSVSFGKQNYHRYIHIPSLDIVLCIDMYVYHINKYVYMWYKLASCANQTCLIDPQGTIDELEIKRVLPGAWHRACPAPRLTKAGASIIRVGPKTSGGKMASKMDHAQFSLVLALIYLLVVELEQPEIIG